MARLAAGRARALGVPTRGTTHPNRLRRMDRWIVHRLGSTLAAEPDPLVIDLGYGATPVTTVELGRRLRLIQPQVPCWASRLNRSAWPMLRAPPNPPGLDFARGGFELAGRHPLLVRAANVLRQYDEAAAAKAWATLRAGLAPSGSIVEGTSNEIGRLATWVLLDESGPISLTLAAHTRLSARPATWPRVCRRR